MEDVTEGLSAWDYAVDYLDNELSDSTVMSSEQIDELEKELLEEKKNLENQLSMKRHNLADVQKKHTKIQELKDNASCVIEEVDQVIEEVSHHLATNEDNYKGLNKTTHQMKDIDKCSFYFACVAELEELSSFVQSAMLIENMDQAVDHFTSLVSLAEQIKGTKCTNLFNYVQSTVVYWYKILLDSLAGEMEQTLQAFGWPFIVTSLKQALPVNAPHLRDNVGTLVNRLLKIQLPDFLSTNVEAVFKCRTRHDICLPMQFFLAPFRVRFTYHFTGDRKTNDIGRPEWYFTQVNLYLNDHKNFLVDKLQKIFEDAGRPQVNVLHEFVEGLMLLVSDKLRTDLKKLLDGTHPNSDQLVAHHVDEALSFHSEVSSAFSSPEALPGCLEVLVEKEIFKKWLSVEKEYALRKMDGMFSMKDAWLVHSMQGDGNDDPSDAKLPQFAELFFMLLATIQDRYAFLPSADCQLKFCRLQLYLLDDFRIRLFQIKKQVTAEEKNLVENKKYIAILNTVAFMVEFLKKWSEDPFYVRLSYHKNRTEGMDLCQGTEELEGLRSVDRQQEEQTEGKSADEIDDDNDLDVRREEQKRPHVEMSIFDGMVELYELMMSEMVTSITNYIFADFKENCKPYIKDKWLTLPSHKEFLTLTLSNSACPMLRCLKSHLDEMEDLLGQSLFTSLWQGLTQLIDDHIFNNVVCTNRFNDGGAAQLNFDMTRNLFPIFLRYSNKPENFFKSIKEACIVLTLAPGSALLIKDVLWRVLRPSETRVEVSDPVAALHDIGVYKLHLEQVDFLLRLRVDIQT